MSHWKDLKSFKNETLGDLANNLKHIAQSSKSKSSIKSYDYAFNRFRVWCKDYSLQALPASVSTISVYLSYLIQKEVSTSVLQNAFYAIKWEHELNLCSEVFSDSFLQLVLGGGVRILSKPVNKKEPITADILRSVLDKFSDLDSLPNLRICSMMLIGYAGFLRFSELATIKSSNLVFHNSHIEITIESSKTDVYRQGNTILIAKTNTNTCPVTMLERYIKATNVDLSSSDYIFRSITYLKSKNMHILSKINKPISYTRARELLLDALSEVGLEKEKFGLHSLRSGGVTQAAHNRVPERLLKTHGRWKSDLSKDGYIKENVKNRLSVSLNLNL